MAYSGLSIYPSLRCHFSEGERVGSAFTKSTDETDVAWVLTAKKYESTAFTAMQAEIDQMRNGDSHQFFTCIKPSWVEVGEMGFPRKGWR